MKSKKLYIIITILIIIFLGYLLLVAFGVDPFDDRDKTQINGLHLTQDEFTITAAWDSMDCDEYSVNIDRNGQIMVLSGIKDNHYKILNVTPGNYYRVSVSAHLKNGGWTKPVKENMVAERARQAIGVNLTEYYGFTNNEFKIKPEAVGDIEFSTSDPNVAVVSQKGKVSLKERGEAVITITASGNHRYDEASREIPVVVYPETLDKVRNIKVENISGSRAVIRWKGDELASSYTILKKDPTTGDFEKIKELSADKNYYEVTRTDFDYEIKSMAEVAGTKVDGKASDPVEVRGTTQEAAVYTEAKNIKTLDEDSLKLLAVTEGPGKTHSPQSVSLVGDKYVVTFVNGKGNKGNLVMYDKDGKVTGSVKADDIGHGNGTAYNPYTKKLYITKAQKNASSLKCGIFDGESKTSISTFNLPKYTSGIAYDETNNKYYLSKANRLYICNSDFKVEKKLMKTIRYLYPQDIAAYNGTVLVCTWVKKKTSYIDMYRASDGAYLGSYLVPMGEIEGCTVDDGYLVILVNKKGSKDRLYKTKSRIDIP